MKFLPPFFFLSLLALCLSVAAGHADDDYISQWNEAHPKNGLAYCGPVAAANSMTRLFQPDSKSVLATRPQRVIAAQFARAMGTHPEYGTPVPYVASGMRLLLRAYGYTNTQVRVYGPGTDTPTMKRCETALKKGDLVMLCVRLYRQGEGKRWKTHMGHWFSLKSLQGDRVTLVDPTHGWEIEAFVRDAPESLSKVYHRPKKILHASPFRSNFTVVDSIVVVCPGKRTRGAVADSKLPRQSVKSTEKYTRLYIPKKPEKITTP